MVPLVHWNFSWELILICWKNPPKDQLKEKAKSAVHGVLNSIAPGQENKLLRLIQLDNTEDEENAKPYTDMVDLIVKLFQESSSSLTRRQLLSMIGDKFTKKELQELIPGLTTYCIDQARLHAFEYGKGNWHLCDVFI